MDIGDRLKELMNDRRVTAYEVCDATRLSQAALSLILNKKTTKLSIKTAEVLSDYFKVSKEWLQNGIGEKGIPDNGIDQSDPEILNKQNEARIELLKEMVEKQSAKIEELIRENARLYYLNNGK